MIRSRTAKHLKAKFSTPCRTRLLPSLNFALGFMAALFLVGFLLLSSARAEISVFQTGSFSFLFESGWEDGQALGFVDRVQYKNNVSSPKCGRYRGVFNSGSYSLKVEGSSRASYAYCYQRVFDLNLAVMDGLRLSYWIYHAQGTPKISVDGHFTDGTTIRDLYNNGYLTDQFGVRIHPGARRDPMNQWYYVEVDLSKAAGKTLAFILFAFDNGNDGFTGQYRAYVDDFKIFNASALYDMAAFWPFPKKIFHYQHYDQDGNPLPTPEKMYHEAWANGSHFTIHHWWDTWCPQIADVMVWSGDKLYYTDTYDFHHGILSNISPGHVWADRWMEAGAPARFNDVTVEIYDITHSGCAVTSRSFMGSRNDRTWRKLVGGLSDWSPLTGPEPVPVVCLHETTYINGDPDDLWLEQWYFHKHPSYGWIAIHTKGFRKPLGSTDPPQYLWDERLINITDP